MGKQAKLKEKRRREEQRRSKARNRTLTTLNETFAEARARVAAAYDNANPAERKALEARWNEYAEAADANPGEAAAAARMAKRIITLPVGRNSMPAAAAADGDYPRLRAKVIAALNTIHITAPTACPHLTAGTHAACICIDEPNTALCTDCMNEHSRTDHPPTWNHTCLNCGSVDMRGISPVMIPPILGLPIRFNGSEHLFLGPVVLIGLGVCNPCRLAAGRRRGRAS